MAQQIINLGAAPNDRTGDGLRSGGAKINANFAELYAPKPRSWPFGVYYGWTDTDDLAAFQTLALDADIPKAMVDRWKPGRSLLGYVAACEVDHHRTYFPFMQSQPGWLITDHIPSWPDASYLDLRNADLRAYLINTIIAEIITTKGFPGLFIDTLDDADVLEPLSGLAGYTAACATFVAEVRAAYPSINIMINRGFTVCEHPNAVGKFNMLLAESLRTTWVGEPPTYERHPPSSVEWSLERVANCKTLNPDLELYALEYWNPADTGTIADLYLENERAGFRSYVSTKDLQSVIPYHGAIDGAAVSDAAALREMVVPRVVPNFDDETITLDLAKGLTHTLTIWGSRTMAAPLNLSPGQVIRVFITQGSPGGHALTWDSVWKWPGGTPPVLSAAQGAVDMVEAVYDGAILAADIKKGFA